VRQSQQQQQQQSLPLSALQSALPLHWGAPAICLPACAFYGYLAISSPPSPRKSGMAVAERRSGRVAAQSTPTFPSGVAERGRQ